MKMMMAGAGQISCKEDFVDALLSVIDCDMPMRNFTIRVYVHLLSKAKHISDKQREGILKAYKKGIQDL
jgi:hypothetical protein